MYNFVELEVNGDEIRAKNPEILEQRAQPVPYDPRFPNQNQTR